jgi:hypothetical protein
MNAKAKIRGDGAQLARYLLTGEEGETAELVSTRGLSGFTDPEAAFAAFERIAELNTRSTKPFLHGHIRIAPGEHLTDAQWERALERMEKRLGCEGQPRIVSFHTNVQTGEKHMHVAWFRINLETMKALDPGLYKNNLKQMCRALEKEFCLREVSNFRKPEDRARIADRNEVEEARRNGMDDRAIRNVILDCLQRTDGGKAFKAALDERGLILSNGDRRDCFVVIDQAGGHHALNKKLSGLTLPAMRDRLSDLDRTELPGVDQAKAMQEEKFSTKELARADWDRRAGVGPQREAAQPQTQPETSRSNAQQPGTDRPEVRHPAYAHESVKARPEPAPTRGKAADEIKATWTQSPAPAAFTSAMHDQGYRLARVSAEEARDSERMAAFAKKLGHSAPKYREGEIVVINDRGWTYRLTEKSTGAERTDIYKFTAEMKDTALPRMGEAKLAQLDRAAQDKQHQQMERWHGRPATKIEEKILGIQEAAERGGMPVTAGLQAEGLTLARVDAAGKASVEKDYLRQYENDKLQGKPNARLRKANFQEGELVAVTRWGATHRINPRLIDVAKLEQEATGGKTHSLSVAREFFATARQQDNADRTQQWDTIKAAGKTGRAHDHVVDAVKRAVPETVGSAVKGVATVFTAAGKFISLASFVESLFGMGPGAASSSPDQQHAPQTSGGAEGADHWEEIYDATQKGRGLSEDFVRNLPPSELQNLHRLGDAGISNKILDMHTAKAKAEARSWEEYDRGGRELER